jgi:hypothetical protein
MVGKKTHHTREPKGRRFEAQSHLDYVAGENSAQHSIIIGWHHVLLFLNIGSRPLISA